MKKLIFSFSLVLVFGFTSCKKEGCTNEMAVNFDTEAKKDDGTCELAELSFDISSPLNGATFGLNQSVPITAIVNANYDLTGYTLKLTNTTKGEVVLESTIETTSQTFTISESWVNTVTHHSDMMLEITVTDNTDYEIAKGTSVMFHCHPM